MSDNMDVPLRHHAVPVSAVCEASDNGGLFYIALKCSPCQRLYLGLTVVRSTVNLRSVVKHSVNFLARGSTNRFSAEYSQKNNVSFCDLELRSMTLTF